MRKTIMLGTLIVLFGAAAPAQARDVTVTEPANAVEAAKPDALAVQNQEDVRERRSASRAERHENRDGSRHDEAERHNGGRKHDRSH